MSEFQTAPIVDDERVVRGLSFLKHHSSNPGAQAAYYYINFLREKLERLTEQLASIPSSASFGTIPIDHSMILNAKEAEKVGMDRITISVPVKDILYEAPRSAIERNAIIEECAKVAEHAIVHVAIERVSECIRALKNEADRTSE